jgi:hypothetical protein
MSRQQTGKPRRMFLAKELAGSVAGAALVSTILLLTVLLASGCTAPAAPTAPAPTPVVTIAPTRLPTTVPTVPPASPALTVTLGDDGKVIQLKLGDRFLLSLDGYFDWTVTVDDPAIVGRLPGLPGPAGSQGVFQAASVGQTTVSAVGDPPCRKVIPACGAPSRLFRVTVVVR